MTSGAMKRIQWSDQEIALAMIFDSWEINHGVIGKLLMNRWVSIRGATTAPGDERTAKSVTEKLSKLRRENPQLTSLSGEWNLAMAHQYILQLSIDLNLHFKMVLLTPDEVDMIRKVSWPGFL
jgi:hypothetical protein